MDVPGRTNSWEVDEVRPKITGPKEDDDEV